MKLVIGCPLYKRAWILHHWIKCILNQSFDLSKIGFIFEVSPNDDETISILEVFKKLEKRIPYFEIVSRSDIPHFEHIENGRNWSISKYENMVSLRNFLLNRVREIDPDYYFSLDSDILLENSSTIELLIAHMKSGADAVNPLMFMTPVSDMYPSVMSWREDIPSKAYRLQKYPIGEYFQADVIMAAKMMSRKVFRNIDYSIHEQGEDIAWSYECKLRDYRLFCASYLYAPHIMSINMYKDYLQSGDSRAIEYKK